ncbi:MAG: Lin0512 family protein [Pseudomonadota bacterium]
MGERRFILEMGQGISLHARDATQAAVRAVEDALRHSSLALFGTCGLTAGDMRVVATVGVPRPEEVDVARVAAALPHGRPEVRAVLGGLEAAEPGGGAHLIATAAVEAFVTDQAGKWRKG